MVTSPVFPSTPRTLPSSPTKSWLRTTAHFPPTPGQTGSNSSSSTFSTTEPDSFNFTSASRSSTLTLTTVPFSPVSVFLQTMFSRSIHFNFFRFLKAAFPSSLPPVFIFLLLNIPPAFEKSTMSFLFFSLFSSALFNPPETTCKLIFSLSPSSKSIASAFLSSFFSSPPFLFCFAICLANTFAIRVSSSSSFRLFSISIRSLNCSSLSLGLYVMNHPFAVSSMSHNFSLPKYFTNSVSVVHLVEFMCTCVLFPMYSLYATVALILVFLCDTAIMSKKFAKNCSEYPFMNLPEFSPNTAT
mmetsp:Transcript_4642/g.15042  ORF Transcript_4642/g.15042 Transcript_4642/m.15042 type:complete len:299 (+) Transcript_4642:114-1010(+)